MNNQRPNITAVNKIRCWHRNRHLTGFARENHGRHRSVRCESKLRRGPCAARVERSESDPPNCRSPERHEKDEATPAAQRAPADRTSTARDRDAYHEAKIIHGSIRPHQAGEAAHRYSLHQGCPAAKRVGAESIRRCDRPGGLHRLKGSNRISRAAVRSARSRASCGNPRGSAHGRKRAPDSAPARTTRDVPHHHPPADFP